MTLQPLRRRRRGAAVIELIVTLGLSLMVGTTLLVLLQFMNRIWFSAGAEVSAKDGLYQAAERMGPDIRSALRIDTVGSSATQIRVVLPRTDAAGNYLLPVSAGNTVAFYLSDLTGATDRRGSILWRSVAGVPDTDWSLRNGRGRTDLGSASLTFAYDAGLNPRGVRITVATTQAAGSRNITRSASLQVALRNQL